MRISVIGGDLRQITLASLLKKDGHNVEIFGFDKEIDTLDLKSKDSLKSVADADVVVLPLPISYDNVTINAPFSDKQIFLNELLEGLKKDAIIFGGRFTEGIKKLFGEKSIRLFDYFEREELSVLNAIPTAEGAIEIAMSETAYTLHKSKCLVIGYGRISKVLARLLKAFGAEVCVSARKPSDLAWIEVNGYIGINTSNIKDVVNDFGIIFNTVPSKVLDEEALLRVEKNALIIDLSSKPGGVDFKKATELGLKVIWALSLPGKVAPITSGEIIKNTIINILNEMEG